MHPFLERLEASLRATTPRLATTEGSPARAAVALAFRADRVEPELLLIRRAVRAGDPWSGQVALPGGRWSPGDEDMASTAIRETLEETGLDVRDSGSLLGVLDELRPRTPTLPPIIVTPYVAWLHRVPPLVLSDEVASAFWVPWSELVDPARDRESEVHVRGATWRVPSFVVGEDVVWGMTERILRGLMGIVAAG